MRIHCGFPETCGWIDMGKMNVSYSRYAKSNCSIHSFSTTDVSTNPCWTSLSFGHSWKKHPYRWSSGLRLKRGPIVLQMKAISSKSLLGGIHNEPSANWRESPLLDSVELLSLASSTCLRLSFGRLRPTRDRNLERSRVAGHDA